MNNKLRIAALSIAAAFICSTTGDFSYEIFNGNNTSVSYDNVIARELSAEIVSANQTAPVIEQLSVACKEKNTEEISHICDKILDEMNAAKEEVAAYAIKGGKLEVNNSADLKETIYDWAGVLIWQLL